MIEKTVENKENKSSVILYFLIAAVLIIGAGGLYFVGGYFFADSLEIVETPLNTSPGLVHEQDRDLVGKPAPEFELPYALASRSDLYAFQGRTFPAMLVFWATWHQGSVDQLRILNDINVAGVDILAVNLQESKDKAAEIIPRLSLGSIGIKVFVDETGETGELYNVKTLPTAFFIDGRGIVRDIFVGVLNKNMLEEKINKLIIRD